MSLLKSAHYKFLSGFKTFTIFFHFSLRPIEVLVQKFKCFVTAHGVAAIEKFYFCFISKIKLVIKIFHLSILISNPLIRLNNVMMTSLNHEWSWKYEVSHFRITECAPHIEIGHFPFQTVHETSLVVRVSYFS